MNKAELLRRIEDGRQEIVSLWAGASDEQLTARPGPQADWSIKDLMAHLAFWEGTLLENVPLALHGEKPADDNVDETNARVFTRNLDRSLADVRQEFERSLEQVRELIQSLSDEALGQPGPWDSEVIWQYILGETADHYQQHIDDVRRWRARTLE